MTEVVTVDVRTLDSLIDELGRARLIVVDAEGAELAILSGARSYIRRHRPAIVVEASPPHLARAGETIEALCAEVIEQGYQPWEIARLSLLDVDPREPRPRATWNWLCLSVERRDERHAVRRSLRRSALLPCVLGINPLTRGRNGAFGAAA